MTTYRLLRHVDYDRSASQLPETVQRKATWAQVLLGTRGRTPTVKNTTGQNAQWRRTPVQGSHYYLWWIPAADAGLTLADASKSQRGEALLVHSVRHHDETDEPIEVGEIAQYLPVELGLLDPRFDDQAEIGREAEASDLTLSVIEGMPGSGKSVALIYLARDLALRPGLRKVRYITYTERLKRSSREIFDALGPEIAKLITVHTINDVVRSLLEKELKQEGDGRDAPAIASTPFSELRSFARDIEKMQPRDVGLWREVPLTLYTELRAEVVGRTFPVGYQLPIHREEQLRRHGAEIDVGRYARQRNLDPRSAQQAIDLANRLRGPYFSDQLMAARALDKIVRGDVPSWLSHTDAIIVDEVQDLTLVQIALVAEMARLRALKQPDMPLAVTVAGDESQIVQPTGFKWGVTKDLLKDRLGVLPKRHEFDEQRRSPALLARLVSGTWGLYDLLPKELRPSARQPAKPRDVEISEDVEPGLVVLSPPPATGDDETWRRLLDELSSRPGRALIDLTESLTESHPGAQSGAQTGTQAGTQRSAQTGAQPPAAAASTGVDPAAEVLFVAREIKGLERATILVYGIGALFDRTSALANGEDERIHLLEARRLIDQMRVALSRSTNRLILIEDAASPFFKSVDFDTETDALNLTFEELIEFLQSEQMTETEMIDGLLEEADDLADRGRVDEAIRRNRRAAAVAQRIASEDLVQRTDSQYARFLLHQSESLLAAGHVEAAQVAFATRAGLTDPEVVDDEVHARVATLRHRLAVAADTEVETLLQQGEHDLAMGAFEEAVSAGDRAMHIAEQEQAPGRFEAAAQFFLHALDASAVALAEQRDSALSPQIAALIRRQSAVEESQEHAVLAQALRVIAARYEEIPGRSHFGDMALLSVLQSIENFLALLEQSSGERLSAGALAHPLIWLDETFADLGDRVRLYYKWALTAASLARTGDFPQVDEHIWELENRLELTSGPASDHDSIRLRAFLADYNGKPEEASLLWEQVGAMDQAIESAREAGDLERAQSLIKRHSTKPVPNALAIAVKVIRQLEELEQKHRSLTVAERITLLEEITRVHDAISASIEQES